jgi:hypothetical protein
MLERPEDAYDANRNFAAIRDALPIDNALYERMIETVKQDCQAADAVSVIKEEAYIEYGVALVAVDVVLRFILHHQIAVTALYAHNKQELAASKL